MDESNKRFISKDFDVKLSKRKRVQLTCGKFTYVSSQCSARVLRWRCIGNVKEKCKYEFYSDTDRVYYYNVRGSHTCTAS